MSQTIRALWMAVLIAMVVSIGGGAIVVPPADARPSCGGCD